MNRFHGHALFDGHVRHRRHRAGRHRFLYRLGLVLLDVDRTESFQGGWLRSFRRSDYHGHAAIPLKESVRLRVEEQLGFVPRGRVLMLTQLRSFGYLFNPVTFYLCHDEGDALVAVVAEITNTPWRERFDYVLDARDSTGTTTRRWTFAKAFHVSPFHGMDHEYRWTLRMEGDHLAISMVNFRDGKRQFDASLVGILRPLTRRSLRRQAMRSPFQGQRMHLAIYWHALRLFLKRATFHVHPDKRSHSPAPEDLSHEPACTDHCRSRGHA